MSDYVIPIIFLIVLLVSFFKKKDPYAYFVEGSRSALSLMLDVFPYLLTIMMAVEVFKVSGVSGFVARFTSPVFGAIGLPPELSELILLRPLSGAGSLAVLDNIFAVYGADTYIGNCASVIYGSSETIFYVSTIYLSKCKTKKLGYALPVAVVSTVLGCMIGCAMLRLTFL